MGQHVELEVAHTQGISELHLLAFAARLAQVKRVQPPAA